jgi:hypothetical protein
MTVKRGGVAMIGGVMLLLAGLVGARAEDAPRFPKPDMEQLNPDQQAVAAEVLKQSSAGLGGPIWHVDQKPGASEMISADDRLFTPEDVAAASAQ